MLAKTNAIQESIMTFAPENLVEQFLVELGEVQRRYHISDWRPSQLSGARLSEAALRICEHVVLGAFTPLGKHLKVPDVVMRLEGASVTNVDDTFKFHVPRAVRAICDLRNKRDVAHLSNGVSPNASDALLILTLSNWVAAEFVRVGNKLDLAEAQRLVDSLVARKVPLVYESGNVVRILDTSLRAREKALVLLLHFQHAPAITVQALAKWIQYPNVSRLRTSVLRELNDEAYIHLEKDTVQLLPPGQELAEKIIGRKR